MPGGIKEYVKTLTRILERIKKDSPTYDELLAWFKSEYKLSGQKTPRSYLEYLKRFGFFKELDGRLYLTDESLRFLESRDNRIVFSVLVRNVLGLSDILDWLSAEPLLESEIHERLVKKYGLTWKAPHQTYFRLTWLQSLGYIAQSGGKYCITDEGRAVLTGEKTETAPAETAVTAPAIPPTLEKYIGHATKIIERFGDMDEANTISTLIEPLLEALGWNIRDPEEVQRQYPIKVGEKIEYVDIALKIKNKPVMFIEAKSVGTNLRDYLAEQPINYAHTERVDWCILTNGKEWRVYNAFWKLKGIDGKMFLKLSLDEFGKCPEKVQLLSKESFISGRLEEKSKSEYARRIIFEWFKQNENAVVKEITQLDPSVDEKIVKQILSEIIRKSANVK